jgi:hypothetical protein
MALRLDAAFAGGKRQKASDVQDLKVFRLSFNP